jgi:hypothetical protein
MVITMVKGAGTDGVDRDRVYVGSDGDGRRAAVHVVHDLPHLVVESLFGITDGLWGELAGGRHDGASRAATARHPKRQKQGRIVSGAASASRTDEWLSGGHRLAKTVTNAVVNRWGDGPDTPDGVRCRLDREKTQSIQELMCRVDDDTITAAIQGVRELNRLWASTPPGGTLRLTWPLDRTIFC